MSVFHIKDNIL